MGFVHSPSLREEIPYRQPFAVQKSQVSECDSSDEMVQWLTRLSLRLTSRWQKIYRSPRPPFRSMPRVHLWSNTGCAFRISHLEGLWNHRARRHTPKTSFAHNPTKGRYNEERIGFRYALNGPTLDRGVCVPTRVSFSLFRNSSSSGCFLAFL